MPAVGLLMLRRLLGRLVEILDALRSSLMAIYYYLLRQLALDFRLHSVLDYCNFSLFQRGKNSKKKQEKKRRSEK